MDAEKLRAVKLYMKVDDDCGEAEDQLIWSLYLAAKVYLGVPEPSGGDPMYDLALWRLTLHYYDHRDAVGNEADFPAGLRPIINSIKAGQGYPAVVD